MQTILVILGLASFLFGGFTGFTVEGFHLGGAGFMACGLALAGISAHGQLFGRPKIVMVGGRPFIARPGEKWKVFHGKSIILLHGKHIGVIERLYEFRVGDEVTFWQTGNPNTVGVIEKIQIPGPRKPEAIYFVNSPRGPSWLEPSRLKLWNSNEH